MSDNPVVETYSRLASEYDSVVNRSSCWGLLGHELLPYLRVKDVHRSVVDVGCGPGVELTHLAAHSKSSTRFIGVEPAPNMRQLAETKTAGYSNVEILPGGFEALPLRDNAVDYLYSILAFHWATDLESSVAELGRVLAPAGEMDLMFIGRENGKEFIRATTPVFFRYLRPAALLRAASLRHQLTIQETVQLFQSVFPADRLRVEESFHTYYDTLEGHWAWWIRIEGQLVEIPHEKKDACDVALREAISTLTTESGIPYTVHLMHVRLG